MHIGKQIRIVFTALVALIFATAAFAASRWQNVEQEVTILPNGNVRIVDTRTLSMSGGDDFGEAFICIEHPNSMRITMDKTVSRAISQGPSYSVFQQSCAGGTELVVKNSSRVTERRVVFAYEVSNSLAYYSDVVEWYWQVVEQDRPTINGYNLTVHFPEALTGDYDAFVHRYTLSQSAVKVRMNPALTELHVEIANMSPGVGLDIRAFMPPTGFTQKSSTPGFQSLLLDEASFARLNVIGSPTLKHDKPREGRVGAPLEITGSATTFQGRQLTDVNIKIGQSPVVPCTIDDGQTFTCTTTIDQRGSVIATIAAIDSGEYRGTSEFSITGRTWLDMTRRSRPLASAVAALLLLPLLIRLIREYFRVGREPKPPAMKYQFEPPSDLPGALALAIQHQKNNETTLKNALYATLLDLTRRGHLTLEQDGKKTAILMHENEDDPLEPFEQELLTFLRPAASKQTSRITHNQLKRRMQARGATFMKQWAASIGLALAEERGGPNITEASEKASSRVQTHGVIALLAAVGGAFLFRDNAAGIMIGTAIVGFILTAVAGAAIPAFRPEIAAERAQWLSFQRTLRDYTIMKDAPTDFFKMWDHYFIYAAAFGVAARYLKNIARAAPLHGLDETALITSAAWINRGGSMNISNLASLTSTATSISNSLSTATASASSGGSVGGGGGASGGGGSSGGR